MENPKRKQQARTLRSFRKIHRTTGAFLFVFFFVVSISGLLLGWKKNSGGLILPKTSQGTSTNLNEWLQIDSLSNNARRYLKDSVSSDLTTDFERIDLRPDKGIVKFVFKDHFWGLQLDGATGKLLQIERRNSDIIEGVHDGSILDRFFDTGNTIKLIYTSIMGLALLVFTITGFWLWYGPKRMRNLKN
jgi:uncharacterized iron-regulated membrane protein